MDKTPLNLPMPDPIKHRSLSWVVVTPDNADQIFKQLESKGLSPVLFAITDDGYRELALTMSEIRNLISSQRAIIIKYKEYYEVNKDQEKK